MLKYVLFLALAVNAGGGSGGADEESEDSNSTTYGLIACAVIFIPIFVFCCWREHEYAKNVEDVEAPWARDASKKFMPNPELVAPVYLDILQLIDLDGDAGSVDHRELSLYFNDAKSRALIEKFDKDKSGTLSVWELKAMWPTEDEATEIRDHIIKVQEEEFEKLVPVLDAIVDLLDVDPKNGTVDVRELTVLFQDPAHAERQLAKADRDGTGTLEVKEFTRIFPTARSAESALKRLQRRIERQSAGDDDDHAMSHE